MVDLHCHILPGLDDGAATMEESTAMAESAIADGITHVVATPHSNSKYFLDFARVRRLRDELQTKAGERLKIATGCDFHLNPENLESLRKDARQYCIKQRDFAFAAGAPEKMDTPGMLRPSDRRRAERRFRRRFPAGCAAVDR